MVYNRAVAVYPGPSTRADLILHNVHVITQDPERPRARAVAVGGGRILAVGDDAEVLALRHPGARTIDGEGRAVLPGFIDAHCHLLAYAASLLSVDCSPSAVTSITQIKEAIRQRAAATPPGRWIRAVGYSEADLAEGRHPNRWDLDEAAPNHPVRLLHRSGRACVLNSRALALAGIDSTTPEPPGGYMERDPTTGEPTGVLLEMNQVVDRVVPPLSYDELAQGVAQASQALLAAGVTHLQDATATNGPDDLALLARLTAEGHLRQPLTAMIGYDALGQWPELRRQYGPLLGRGTVKLVIQELGEYIHPAPQELQEMVQRVHQAGLQVAVHAVGQQAVAAAADALAQALSRAPKPDHRHRIEHCAVCPPSLAQQLGRLGVVVVTQPSFLYHNGERYLHQVPPAQQRHLYALRTLARQGVLLAASSDAPVVPPLPILGIHGAAARRTAAGRPIPGRETLPIPQALALFTAQAARACFLEDRAGMIAVGRRADMLMLSADPTTEPPPAPLSMAVMMTLMGGQVAYTRGSPAAVASP